MWMCDPSILCVKHLNGSHVELHKLVGHLNKKKSITGWIDHNCLQPLSIQTEHKKIVKEMLKRGYNHKSPLPQYDISYLPSNEQNYQINKEQFLHDLLNRCEKCRERYERYLQKQNMETISS